MSTSTDSVRRIEDLPCWRCTDPRGADLRQKRLGHSSPDVTLRIYRASLPQGRQQGGGD
jgi:hypothetical protein